MKFDGLVYDLDEATYHGLPGLSSTGAKKILRSPAHFQHYISTPHEEKSEFDVGSLVHAKVLGVGAKHTVYPDGNGPETYVHDGVEITNVLDKTGGLRTTASKMFADEARAHGLIPVKRVQARVINKIAESVLSNDTARALVEGGHAEVSMFATDPVTGVDCRGRLDYLRPKTITDLKTSAGAASESEFARQFFRIGYDVQFGHYDWLYKQITGESLPFLWIVVETEAPYVTNVFALEDKAQEIGRERAARARARYAEARDSGRWTGYANEQRRPIGLIKAPQFAIYDSIDEENAS